MARDGERFFMYFFSHLGIFLRKVLFSSVVHFFIGSLIFGEFSILYSLCILVISPLSNVLKKSRMNIEFLN
jgi:hypothetical protein